MAGGASDCYYFERRMGVECRQVIRDSCER